MNDDRKRKLAELEELEREMAEKEEANERELFAKLDDPRVQRGLAVLAREQLFELAVEVEIRSLEDQLEGLMYHLVDAHVAESEDELVATAQEVYRELPEAIQVCVRFEELLYFEDPATRTVIAERDYGGRVQRAIVSDDDGSLGEWHDSPFCVAEP